MTIEIRNIFFVFLFGTARVFSQNLVLNPSFEDTVVCPYSTGNINNAVGWHSSRNTPDYYNSCANINASLIGVPTNFAGSQYAFDGNAYVGLGVFRKSIPNLRECISSQLSGPLTIGTKYYVSGYVSRADTIEGEDWAGSVNKFGFKFTTTARTTSQPISINNFSHVHSDTIFKNKNIWYKVAGSFIADSSYNFIHLGNFYDDANTDTFMCPEVAYLYVDLICVSTDSTCSNDITNINSLDFSNNIVISPNPASDLIKLKSTLEDQMQLKIFDTYGSLIYQNDFKIDLKVNTCKFPNGIYFLIIESTGRQLRRKLVVRH